MQQHVGDGFHAGDAFPNRPFQPPRLRVNPLIRADADGIQAQRSGKINGALEMKALRDDNHVLNLKHVSRPVHAAIRVESGVIHENILRRNAAF